MYQMHVYTYVPVIYTLTLTRHLLTELSCCHTLKLQKPNIMTLCNCPILFSPAKAPWQILAYPHPSQDSDLKSHGIQPTVFLDSGAPGFH